MLLLPIQNKMVLDSKRHNGPARKQVRHRTKYAVVFPTFPPTSFVVYTI